MIDKLKPKMTNAGFTLVEVLMAMIILLVGLLAVGSMQIMAMKGNQHARETTVRTTTADNVMEWLMSLDFNDDNLRDTSGTLEHILTADSDGKFTVVADDDDSDGHEDTPPPENLVPNTSTSNDPITKIVWIVSSNGGGTAKTIKVIVNWDSDGKAEVSNIKPSI